jgi:predicted ATPase
MKRPGKITQLRISGMRVIEDLTLDLDGMTVLIGDNGTGKSTILEALEILRLATKPGSFIKHVIMSRHGGMEALLRRGAGALRLGCRVRLDHGVELDYDMELHSLGSWAFVAGEWAAAVDPQIAKDFPAYSLRSNSPTPGQTVSEGLVSDGGPDTLALSTDSSLLILDRLRSVLEQIDVQAPFEARPYWQHKELDLRVGARMPSVVETVSKLSRYGVNLANAYQELRNRSGDTWQRVLDRARLGIHHDISDFRMTARRRGEVELELIFLGDSDNAMPVEYLSEGQVSYLAMIALCELSALSSVLAFDEPEIHLHPGLLARVMLMLEKVSQSIPVLLSTHSERLLDCLPDPAASVVLCDLDERGALRIRRPEKEALATWLERYQSIGRVIAEGYTAHLFDEPLSKNRES